MSSKVVLHFGQPILTSVCVSLAAQFANEGFYVVKGGFALLGKDRGRDWGWNDQDRRHAAATRTRGANWGRRDSTAAVRVNSLWLLFLLREGTASGRARRNGTTSLRNSREVVEL